MTSDPHDAAHDHSQRGTRQLLVARASTVAFGYVATAILTREFGAIEFGIYGVIISQLLWLEMLMNAGVPGATAKLMADGRHDQWEVERSARALLVGWSFALLAVVWLAAPRLANLMRIPDGDTLLRIAFLDLPLMAMFFSYNGALTGRRRFSVLAVVQVAFGIFKLAGILVLIALGISIRGALIAYVMSTGLVSAMLIVRYRPRGLRPRGAVVGEILAITAPIGMYLILAQVLLNLDLWSLKTLWRGGGEVVGYYVASMNLSRMLLVISGAQSAVVFAAVAWAVAANHIASAQRQIQDATRLAVIIATAALVILGMDAAEVLSLLYSRPYAGGEQFLPLQLAAMTLFVLQDIFAQALMASGRQWSAAAVLTATIPVAWLSNLLLIPWLGPMGAVTSLLLGLAISALVAGTIAYRRFGPLVRLPTLVRVLAASAAVGLASAIWPVGGPLIVVKLVLLGVLYLLVLYGLREITMKDFELLKKKTDQRSA